MNAPRILTLLALLCALLSATALALNAGNAKWTATVDRVESAVATGTAIRTITGATYYYDGTRTTSGDFPERTRFDIHLGGGKTASIYDIYESYFIEFSACGNTCGWTDYYGNAFPILFAPAAGGYTPASSINGWTNTNLLRYDGLNGVSTDYLIAATDSARTIVQYSFVRGTVRHTYTVENGSYVPGNTFVTNTTLVQPSYCPAVDPGCWRVDLIYVQDFSGSVGNGPLLQGKQFVNDMTKSLNIADRYVRVGYVHFSDWAVLDAPLTGTRTTFLNQMWAGSNSSSGWTSTASGLAVSLYQFIYSGNARQSARKVLLVLTDGEANGPCQTANLDKPYWNCCETSAKNGANNPVSCTSISCSGYNGASSPGSTSCPPRAITEILYLYSNYGAGKTKQTARFDVFAVGVGDGISASKLLITAQNNPTRVFQVGSWAQLNTLIDRLVALLLCSVPGAFACPNDCVPGGFCCGSGCVCIQDCSTLSNNCQTGYCSVSYVDGTQCLQTPPDNTLCFDGNPCTDDVCQGGIGCVYPSNNLPCNDNNQCTGNDTCTNGQCVGTPSSSLNCTDGNLCTTDQCVLSADGTTASCQSTPVVCGDPDPTDCTLYACNSNTGGCDPYTITEGQLCRPRNDSTSCTIFVCQTGACVEKRLDAEGCVDSSSPPNLAGPIAGSVAGASVLGAAAIIPPLICLLCLALLAGLAVALVCCIALTVCLVCLGLIGAVGFSSTTSLAAVAEPMVALVDNPLHQAAAAEGTSMAYAAE